MFPFRLYSPYQKQHRYSQEQLLADLDKCFTLYDVSMYLCDKIQLTWDERLERKKAKPESFLQKYVAKEHYIPKLLEQRRQKKYEDNLKKLQNHIVVFQKNFEVFKKLKEIIQSNLEHQKKSTKTSAERDQESKPKKGNSFESGDEHDGNLTDDSLDDEIRIS